MDMRGLKVYSVDIVLRCRREPGRYSKPRVEKPGGSGAHAKSRQHQIRKASVIGTEYQTEKGFGTKCVMRDQREADGTV